MAGPFYSSGVGLPPRLGLMDIKTQIALIPKVITSPKVAFQSLPSDRWYLLAWLAPLYFGIARAFRPPNYEKSVDLFGSPLLLLLFVIILALVIIPLGAWIMRQLLKLFKKRLSVKKLMNIYGYALVPRLIVALIGYAVLFSFPSMFRENELSAGLLVILALGLCGMLYTLFLYIYGIVVSPSDS